MQRGFETLLVENGLVTPDNLQRAAEIAGRRREHVLRTLVLEGYVDETAVLQFLARRQNIRFVSLRDFSISETAVKSLSARFVAHYAVMPVSLENRILTIAVSNPFDMSAVEDIQSNLGMRVERVCARGDEISEAIRKYYGVGSETVERILDELPEASEPVLFRESHDLGRAAEDASVVRLVNQILERAIADRATDVHFEVYEDGAIVRRRIDGILHDTRMSDNISVLYPAIVSRIKLMADLNIVERRLPQDGRTRVRIGDNSYDLRISVVPALHGENVVVRILPTTMMLSLEDLGLSERNLEQMQTLIAMPHGIIVVTGPTGSGKSTTLYACLSRMNTRERKIVTIEDPVEYEIRGLTQTQIQPGIGLTFARTLRSMLRHDPDVMMVGEIRDRETAEVTIQTALTGHLVFSTLHTNDAAAAAVRLVDMGIDSYLVASSVRAFTAQRLVRVICPECRENFQRDGKIFFRGRGCRKCGNTGFFGRVALCEILVVDEAIRKLIMGRAAASEIRNKAVDAGMITMLQDGWEKTSAGITTSEEVLRVTSE